MVTFVENGDDPSSNPDRGCLHFTRLLYPYESYEFSYEGKTRLFNLGIATSLKEKKSGFKPVKLCLKIDLVSNPARVIDLTTRHKPESFLENETHKIF